MSYRLQWLCCTAATCLLGAALANEPSPPNVTIATRLALKGNSFVHLQNRESTVMILEISPGPLSSLQFAPKRVTLKPGAAVDINLGNLGFQPGRHRLHIISKLFDPQNAPAGMGPFLLQPVIVSATDIRIVSDGEAFSSRREAVPHTSQWEPPKVSSAGGPLAAFPASREITADAKTHYSVAIRPSSGEVRLSVRGLPQGTTAGFTPNPASRISTLTVNVTKDTKPGAYPLTVNSVTGNLTSSTTVTLVVR